MAYDKEHDEWFKEQPCIVCGEPMGDGPYDGSSTQGPRHWKCRPSKDDGRYATLAEATAGFEASMKELRKALSRIEHIDHGEPMGRQCLPESTRRERTMQRHRERLERNAKRRRTD